MPRFETKVRLPDELRILGEIYRETYLKSTNQLMVEAYETALIQGLMNADPNIPPAHNLIDAARNLLNSRIKRLEDESWMNEWLINYIENYQVVSSENLHNNLNDLMTPLSAIDSAVKFYGQPRIEARVHELLKTRLSSKVITKFGKMFVQIFSDRQFETAKDLLYNELVGNFPSPDERYTIFRDDPDQERQVILYIVDTFYREQLNEMADEIHENINHQITAQKTDIPAPV